MKVDDANTMTTANPMTAPTSGGVPSTPNVVNLVASTRLATTLDVVQLAIDLGVHYEPEQFPGMVFRVTTPKVCVLVFRSGKVVATGAKSYDDAKAAFQKLHDELVKHNYNPWTFPADEDILMQNLVVTYDAGVPLQLPALAMTLPLDRTEYEPEQFPGLIYRISNPTAVCLIFSSGKCVITGTKSLADAQTATEQVHDEIMAAVALINQGMGI
jgi:transcription initiation factor TFIID TATA-box-binding protein